MAGACYPVRLSCMFVAERLRILEAAESRRKVQGSMDTGRLMLAAAAGTGALLALAVLPAGAAVAGTGVSVPCSGSGVARRG